VGGNLLIIMNGPTVTNNYVWTKVSFSQTAPANAAYAVIDFAVYNKTSNVGRWFVYGFTATVGETTTNSYAGCWNCYLSASAAISVPDQGDNWDVTYYSDTICSVAGSVFFQESDQVLPQVTVNAGGNTPYGVLPIISTTVSSISGPTPTGTVNFSMVPQAAPPDNGEALNSAGVATWHFSNPQTGPSTIPVANYIVTAAYQGDDIDNNYLPNENTDTFAVIPAETSVEMSTCPAATVTAGQSVTFKVKISSLVSPNEPVVSPQGTVTLPGSPSSTAYPVNQIGFLGSPSYATISLILSKGTYTIKGDYSGDSNYAPHTSDNACTVTAQ
jgi:hypothetical protein